MQLYPVKATKPLKAIRLFCGECMGMDRRRKKKSYPFTDVKECTDKLCPLFEWRFGMNPYKSQKRVERMREFHKNRMMEHQSSGQISTISSKTMPGKGKKK